MDGSSRLASAPLAKRRFSMRARFASFIYAASGIRLLVRQEHNAWIHLAASAAAVMAGWVARLDRLSWCWIILAIALVWMAEAFNTAIEELCNLVSPGPHPIIGRVKDISAGAVLVAAVAAALIGAVVLLPHLLESPR